jgi:cytochrome c oxidase subunit 4
MSEHNHEHKHEPEYGTPVLVFIALLVLTGLTVSVSGLKISAAASAILALLIATIKGGLVVTYFMHLKYEDKVFWVLSLVSLATLGVVFGFTFFDYSFRDTLFY